MISSTVLLAVGFSSPLDALELLVSPGCSEVEFMAALADGPGCGVVEAVELGVSPAPESGGVILTQKQLPNGMH